MQLDLTSVAFVHFAAARLLPVVVHVEDDLPDRTLAAGRAYLGANWVRLLTSSVAR